MRGFTAEQREKGRLARMENARPKAHLRTDFADEPTWAELGSALKFRLPGYGVECTRARMVRAIHKAGWGLDDYRKWCGYKQPEDWAAANPDWPLRAFVGLLLEAVQREYESENGARA